MKSCDLEWGCERTGFGFSGKWKGDRHSKMTRRTDRGLGYRKHAR